MIRSPSQSKSRAILWFLLPKPVVEQVSIPTERKNRKVNIMNKVSTLPNPSENTFVEIAQDGRHTLYLTDEQLALVTTMFGIIHPVADYRLPWSKYEQLIDYCENLKIIDNNMILNVNLKKPLALDLAATLEESVLEYEKSLIKQEDK